MKTGLFSYLILSVIMSVLLFLGGCSTFPKDENQKFSRQIEIYVPIFKNNTYKPGINEMLTDCAINIMTSSDFLKPVNKDDAEFSAACEVISYGVTSKILDYSDVSQMNRLDITIRVFLSEKDNSGNFSEVSKFDVSAFSNFSETGISPELEKDAASKLYKIISIKLIDKLKKNIYDRTKTKTEN
ncbi:hypothetical protein KA977_09230 [Candidatus Dependentiae bacterium]|nr:hypothetical protein [Candidatus Dependentiae bacterium]